MNRDQKTALVEELSEQIRSADAIFAVDYRGISVAQAAELRGRLRDADARFRVVKNSLTERASDQAGVQELKAILEGPTALAFVSGDAALAAKALSDVGRTLGTLAFKGGIMNGDVLTGEQIQSIARLPAREVLHGQLVGTIAAPLTQLVRTLNALIGGLAVQLQQVAEQGLVTGESSPSEAAGTASASEAPTAPESGDAAGTAAASEAPAAPESDASAEASPRVASDADADPSAAEGEEAAAAEGGEAAAAEVPAETAQEPAPEAEPEAAAPADEAEAADLEAAAPADEAEPPAPEREQTDTEPASDAEASEE